MIMGRMQCKTHARKCCCQALVGLLRFVGVQPAQCGLPRGVTASLHQEQNKHTLTSHRELVALESGVQGLLSASRSLAHNGPAHTHKLHTHVPCCMPQLCLNAIADRGNGVANCNSSILGANKGVKHQLRWRTWSQSPHPNLWCTFAGVLNGIHQRSIIFALFCDVDHCFPQLLYSVVKC